MSIVDRPPVELAARADEFLRVETHGIDPIPAAERKGSPRDVGWLWVAAFANFVSLITGALLIGFGLGVADSLVAVAVGSLLAATLHGLLSVAGPRFGTTQVVAARRTFGLRGAYPGAFFTLFLAVGWFAVDCVIAAQAVVQLGHLAGIPQGTLLNGLALLVVVVLSVLVAVYGHQTIAVFEKYGAIVFVIFCAILGLSLIPQVKWGLPATVSGADHVAAWVLGTSVVFALIASWFSFASDYSRYLPSRLSARSVVGWVAAGTALSMFLFGSLGVRRDLGQLPGRLYRRSLGAGAQPAVAAVGGGARLRVDRRDPGLLRALRLELQCRVHEFPADHLFVGAVVGGGRPGRHVRLPPGNRLSHLGEMARRPRLADWAARRDSVRRLQLMAEPAGTAPAAQHRYFGLRRRARRRRRISRAGASVAIPVALTIAGSDSGAGAGIQADLKTFASFGVYGLTVITAVTAQNTIGVRAVEEIEPTIVAAQLDAVAEDFSIAALKTGMLSSAAIIEVVAQGIRQHGLGQLVIDPVMVAKSGDRLLRPDAVDALRRYLLPLARVVTPNIPEAEVLASIRIRTVDDRIAAARRILSFGADAVVVKGGHDLADPVVDLLIDRDGISEFAAPRVSTTQTHGTGCTFSAAITAGLARGLSVPAAVGEARRYVSTALNNAPGLGHGHGPLQHFPVSEGVHVLH
ncbi:MAG: bifunctional hydroxymethylpyrimidine kinase/phosphomethylpyrimidine kinase [Chloroflexi bacterium]|nr:MAG: bifunctional hydroxymethylpyrimidine kinase/phosphomethylpyrimidine kinase [Chloroflexota bacterium]